ncbi:flippase [Parapedobacter indicus]|uniref:Membrane protein involved in the export of O-antigen and teichoic acid n=1 Tax=Parapedobacter indicus TaxID=1477437 RepID=A0A1I3N0L1_9SPHI|nr:flippase [Parapedobacter indicus]PPL00843.1 O-antigen/teichoic acid export membrane protein [Parapedobacter indicus]SFJ02904.1 Membrane protein involved in the export of O-antigen and teichoic acid [Parapedobacter indicus]
MGSIQRNVVYNVTLSLSQVLFPLLVFPYVSRVLGPEQIGEIAFVDSITQWCVLVAALGISVYGVREIAKVKNDFERRSVVFSELLILHLIATVSVSVFFILSFNTVSSMAPFRHLFWIGTGILFLQSLVMEWLFQGLGAFSYITIRTVAVRILSTLAIFLAVRGPEDSTIYYSLTFFGMLMNVLLNGWYARKFVRFRGKGLHFGKHFKPLFYIFSFAIVTSVYTLLDTVILGFIADKAEVGYYSTAMRVVKLVTTLLVAISTVMVASLSFAFHNGQREDAFSLLRKSFALTVFMGVPLSIGLGIIAPNVIFIFAGSEYGPAAPALQLLAPTLLLIGLNNIFGMQVLNTTNNERLFLRAALVGMVISLSANFLLIPLFRATGAAVANLLAEVSVCLLLAFFALRRFPFRPDWKGMFQAVGAALPMFGWELLLKHMAMPIWVETSVMFGLAGISYFFIQYFIWRNPLVSELKQLVLPKLGIGKKN